MSRVKDYKEIPPEISYSREALHLKVAGFFAVLGLVVFGAVMYLFFEVLEKFEPSTIHLWAAFLTTAVIFGTPLVAFLGFYFGKVEARGFMSGADAIMERVFGKLVDAVQMRENNRYNIKNEAPKMPENTNPSYLFAPPENYPAYPQINERVAGDHRGEVINLD